MRRISTALGAGLVLPLAFAPYGVWILAVVSPFVLLIALRDVTARESLLIGWSYGLGMFGHGVWWIQVSVHQFGVPYYVFSVSVTALFIAVNALYLALFAWLVTKLRDTGAPALLAIPALWVLIELLRSWLFTGFPWLALGYSQIDAPLAGYAPVFGVYGCSAAVIVQAAMLAQMKDVQNLARGLLFAGIISVNAIGAWIGDLEFTELEAPDLVAALIQGAIPQELKWHPDMRVPSIETYQHLSAGHWDADVIIWPETAIPAFPHEVEEITAGLDQKARDTATDLLIGMPTGEPWTGAYFNSLVDFGQTPGRYDKRHLVPFGEFFPFKDVVSGLAMLLHIPMSDFSAGDSGHATLTVAGRLAGISICYEDAFGAEIIDALPEASFLVNISNDAWFGDSIAPHQHLQISRMRALETGRYLLRGTNSGISAIVDHRGRLQARAPQFEASSLRGLFAARSGSTPYVRYRDWPVLIAAVIAVVVSALVGRRRRRGDGALSRA